MASRPAPLFAWILVVGVTFGCHRVEQVAMDKAVFKELDALYTAITSHKTGLLYDSRVRVAELHERHQLSDTGFDRISVIIQQAEQGHWQPAAEQLDRFMRAQRKH